VNFAKLHFLFEIESHVGAQDTVALALISMFCPSHLDLLQQLHNTYFICKCKGDTGLIVINATAIKSVILMIPH
ncbi:hypothetical protein HD554DRAFT_2008685, partial [Boletus coccyginus]